MQMRVEPSLLELCRVQPIDKSLGAALPSVAEVAFLHWREKKSNLQKCSGQPLYSFKIY